jgi:hypothetical protein
MLKQIWILIGCAATIAAPGAPNAAEPFTANTMRLAPSEARPSASIDAMGWLAGTWTGDGLGGENEELWSAPRHGVMMGMYRMIRDGQPVFYELLTLSEVNESLELRLKHFDAALRGWEEKDASLAFPYIAHRDGRIYFEGITFEPRGDVLTVYLAIEDKKKGAVREEVFRYRRAVTAPRD